MANSQKKMKHGTSIKSLKRFLVTISLLKQKHVGGCVGMTSIQISISCILEKFSLQHGNNIPFLMNGKETQQAVPILGRQKKIKIKSVIRMTNGLTILNIDSLFQRKHRSTLV